MMPGQSLGLNLADFIANQNGMQQQQPMGLAQQILSSRFEPTPDDVGNAAMAGLSDNTYVSPTHYADARMAGAFKQMETIANLETAMARTKLYASGGTGNQTLKLAEALGLENPNMSLADRLALIKSTGTVPLTVGPSGITNLPGSVPAAASMAGAKTGAEEKQKLNFAKPIAQAAAEGGVAGRGEITPIAQKNLAQERVNTVITDLRNSYARLHKGGGISSVENSAFGNLGAYAGNTMIGQEVGKAIGTVNQSERNKILQARPLLTTAIMQATGLSSKQMDSNAELNLWLNTATNPSLGKEANDEALNRIELLIGGKIALPDSENQTGIGPQGGAVNLTPMQGRSIVKTQVSPSTGKRKIIYSDGTEEVQ